MTGVHCVGCEQALNEKAGIVAMGHAVGEGEESEEGGGDGGEGNNDNADPLLLTVKTLVQGSCTRCRRSLGELR